MRDLRVTLAVIGSALVLAVGAVLVVSEVLDAPDFTERDRCEAQTVVVSAGQALPCDVQPGQSVTVVGGTEADCARAGGAWSRSGDGLGVCEGMDF